MLKVEKQRGVIAVSERTEQKRSLLLIAFAAAMAIHFFGLLLFHITPLIILGSGSKSPPAMVTSEWREEILSSLDEPIRENTLMPPPKRAVFESKLPELLAQRMLNLPWEKWFQKEIESYIDQTFEKELAVTVTGIELLVSGALAGHSYEWKNPPKEIPKGVSYPAIAKFEVEVNEMTGEIFHKRFLEGNAQLAKIAEEWLTQVQFVPRADRFSTRGQIEWMVGAP